MQLKHLKKSAKPAYDKGVNDDPPASVPETPPIQENQEIKKLPLALIGIVVMLVIISTIFYFLQRQQQNQNNSQTSPTSSLVATPTFPQVKVVIGVISEVKPDFIIVNDNGLQKTKVFVGSQTIVRIQKMVLPSMKEEQASASAKLIGRLQGNEPASLTDLRVKDQVNITLEEKDNQLWAKIITITRKVKG